MASMFETDTDLLTKIKHLVLDVYQVYSMFFIKIGPVDFELGSCWKIDPDPESGSGFSLCQTKFHPNLSC